MVALLGGMKGRRPGRLRRADTHGIDAVGRFPDDNPNPVMRYDSDGRLVYANRSSQPILAWLGTDVGEPLPRELLDRLAKAIPRRGSVELVAASRTYALWPVPIPELEATNLYSTDVTAERAVVKFPDQNPNPVLRFDARGTLIYANPASLRLRRGLGLRVGRRLPRALHDGLLSRSRAPDGPPLEVEAGGAYYTLLPVDVPEFGFVNVYGTDVTAVRERERLAAENERLLLNILPEPIARRLRAGEALIADRHDDVTLLFADIVGFTRLSAAMPAAELVAVLNEVFGVFDGLVEAHGLEKVKTIGDAYMVVGGMPIWTPDHTARMASMALELAAAVDRIETARRLGVAFRIGMHHGPVVAGVIGRRKFIYDVWGDTVNMASRMESTGIPGRIQVTRQVADRLGSRFRFERRGTIEVKGVGPTPTWFVVGRVPSAESRATSPSPA